MTVPAAVLTEIRTLRAESVPSWPAVSLAERQSTCGPSGAATSGEAAAVRDFRKR